MTNGNGTINYSRIRTSTDLVRKVRLWEQSGVKLDYRAIRAEWEAAQVRHFWHGFDLAVVLVVFWAWLIPPLALPVAVLVLLITFCRWMDLGERIHL